MSDDKPEEMTPWQGFLANLRKINDEPEPVGRRGKVLKQYESHLHETWAVVHKKDLNKVGHIPEFSGKGYEKFWPKEDLVDVGHGKKAPKLMNKARTKEFLHRLACEKGYTFTEMNGT